MYALLVVALIAFGWVSQQYEAPPPIPNVPPINESCLSFDLWGHLPRGC